MSSNSWTRLTDLPIAGPTSAITVSNSIFVLLHGKKIVRYLIDEDKYIDLSPLPCEEWFCFDVTSSGYLIYVHGGNIKGKWSKAFYSFDVRTNVWNELPEMIRPRRRCAAAMVSIPNMVPNNEISNTITDEEQLEGK